LVWLKGTPICVVQLRATYNLLTVGMNIKELLITNHDPLIRMILINENMIDC
jgi:hypothetical protein